MVLEQLFPENWLEKKARYAFLLGVIYTIIGIVISKVLFPSDPALVAVSFTSLLLLPVLYKLLAVEERMEEKEKKFTFKKLLYDNGELIRIYIFLALGVFLVYSISSIILPSFEVNTLFREQLELRGASGGAVFSNSLFWNLLLNNWWVLLACFVLSLLTGDGGIFLITWNASVWGTIFGITARNAAITTGENPFFTLIIILAIVTPHAALEMISYILAAISGGVISKDFLMEKMESKRFNDVLLYNVVLFFISIIMMIMGALLETYVLGNVHLYQEIITQSFFAGL